MVEKIGGRRLEIHLAGMPLIRWDMADPPGSVLACVALLQLLAGTPKICGNSSSASACGCIGTLAAGGLAWPVGQQKAWLAASG